jgi:hypothetical protein
MQIRSMERVGYSKLDSSEFSLCLRTIKENGISRGGVVASVQHDRFHYRNSGQ